MRTPRLLSVWLALVWAGGQVCVASSGPGIVAGPEVERPQPRSEAPADFTGTPKEIYRTCFRCHMEQTPAEMQRYLQSEHYANQVRCQECHGTSGHNEYMILSHRFPLRTLGADGKTPIGSGEIRSYSEWWPVMLVRAYQACMSCHPAQYEEFIGVRRYPENLASAVTPFHGYMRYDMGISSWWDTVMANFGLAETDMWGAEMFAEGCVMCHSQTLQWNESGENLDRLKPVRARFPELMKRQEALLGKLDEPLLADSMLMVKCAECHSRHEFSAEEATLPESCAKCHMGPDHPQYEVYSTSKHGWMYQKNGAYPRGTAPSCSTCHYNRKAPDGHTIHASAETVAWNYKQDSPEFQSARESMLDSCVLCHARARARAHLEVADQTGKVVAGGLVGEAQAILDEMYARRLIEPSFSPFFGKPVAFKATFFHALPWRSSGEYQANEAELLFWNVWREFGTQSMESGAFHFNPAYLHWRGLKPASEFIGELRDLKERLESEQEQRQEQHEEEP